MGKLSKVKQLMLDMLSSGKPVKARDLLKASGQAEYARRLRELRDEAGYDIISFNDGGDVFWQLRSKKRKPSKKRTYLGQKVKDKFINENQDCAHCGKRFNKKIKPVFDHRVPLIRGGDGIPENFQVICVDCNNLKRTECKGCERECQNCFFAYPEKFSRPIVIYGLTDKELSSLEEQASKVKEPVAEFVTNLVKDKVKGS